MSGRTQQRLKTFEPVFGGRVELVEGLRGMQVPGVKWADPPTVRRHLFDLVGKPIDAILREVVKKDVRQMQKYWWAVPVALLARGRCPWGEAARSRPTSARSTATVFDHGSFRNGRDMDQSNATRVPAPPDEVAERSDQRTQLLQLSARIVTTNSASFVLGFLLNQLQRAGIVVDAIDVGRPAAAPLASYVRPEAQR